MGDTWFKKDKMDTIQNRTVTIDGHTEKDQKFERCLMCYRSECSLYGVEGTNNMFGCFKGICSDCLNKVIRLKKGEIVYD